jgi:hypothetical protein
MLQNSKSPTAWDIGKRFRRIRDLAGINDLRSHDLRHFAATMLFIEGVADNVIRKMTGHRSEELERYKHFSPEFQQQTTELIASKLEDRFDVPNLSHQDNNENSTPEINFGSADSTDVNGGADGTRTRDLQRDRLKFRLPDFA